MSQWLYAYRVCRKYNIKWNPFTGLDSGSYSCNYVKKTATISVNPFYKDFLNTFMHEVGHVRFWFNGVTLKAYEAERSDSYFTITDKPAHALVDEEARASKFARRSLKNKYNKEFATKCFGTYTAEGYRVLQKGSKACDMKSKFTDCVYKNIKRI